MPPHPITVDDLHGVFAVPPLPRRPGPRRAIDFDAAEHLAAHVEAGLDAVGRLVDDGVARAIKYAVVRDNPGEDDYLEGLLRRVRHDRVLSGIGERPAIAHFQTFGLRSMTTGSGCIAPHTYAAFFSACEAGDWRLAAALRERFMPLEDLRDAWGPARVLHHAAELCGIAATGPIPPFVSPWGAAQIAQVAPVATALLGRGA